MVDKIWQINTFSWLIQYYAFWEENNFFIQEGKPLDQKMKTFWWTFLFTRPALALFFYQMFPLKSFLFMFAIPTYFCSFIPCASDLSPSYKTETQRVKRFSFLDHNVSRQTKMNCFVHDQLGDRDLAGEIACCCFKCPKDVG